jgi:methylphosphotriester-DNA--protein-cysteine methyltransferase
MVPKLSPEAAEGVLWRLIADRQALTMRRFSRALDMSPSQLRRALRRDLGTNFRRLRARARVTYAIKAIRNGDKVEAALREVGLRNRTSFIKQCRLYAGGRPHEFRPAKDGAAPAVKSPRVSTG